MLIKLNIILFCILFALPVLAQTNQLISPQIDDGNQNQQAIQVLLQQPTNISANYININLDVLNLFEQFKLNFDDKDYTVNYDRTNVRGPSNYSWFGDNESGDGNIIISVLGNDVQGLLFIGIEIYSIVTTLSGAHIIVKVDQSQFPNETCIFPDQNNNKTNVFEDTKSNKNTLKQKLAEGCTLRALIYYTEKAETKVGLGILGTTIQNKIQLSVDATNQSFKDSDIFNYDVVEIALIQKTDYKETTFTKDLDNFRINYGYMGNFKAMDEVHALREAYDADFCVLVRDSDPNSCGTAGDLGGSKSFAFFAASYSCIEENLTFAHELGHLLGCHHDTFVANNQKFPYGHGYVYKPGNWRTLMAYSDACASCVRIQRWSNPNKIYRGVPLGTTNKEDNARVCKENLNKVAQFEQPLNNAVLNNQNYVNSLYAHFSAQNKVNSNGTITVKENDGLILKATNVVELQQGLSVKKGAELDILIETIDECK